VRTQALPLVAIGIAAFFNLSRMYIATLVIMHSVPVGVSMIVLSERYNVYKETIALLILVSSLGAAIYLNLWLLILGV
jgi:predicted permease